MSIFNFGRHKSPEQPAAPIAPASEQPPVAADATSTEQFQVPAAAENQTAPQAPEQAPEVSDEEVRKAMGNAAGLLDEVKQAESTGTLDTAPAQPAETNDFSVQNQVAELNGRGGFSDAAPAVVTDQEIVEGLHLPEVPAPEISNAPVSEANAVVPSSAEVPMVVDQAPAAPEAPAVEAPAPAEQSSQQ